jgi:hypothetical protein
LGTLNTPEKLPVSGGFTQMGLFGRLLGKKKKPDQGDPAAEGEIDDDNGKKYSLSER